jgi:hypothetical protein
MTRKEFDRFQQRYPHPHHPFFARPHLTRRHFFQLLGAGVTVSCLPQVMPAQQVVQALPVTPQNKARQVLFILMAGAPSHIDTFDFKMVNGVTPSSFNPTTINGISWPQGLLPNTANHLGKLAIVRSGRAWALVHNLAQTWTQIGRNPAAVLGDVSPNIGSIVALEKEPERAAGQVFPTFLALNSNNAIGNGYLSSLYAPFKLQANARGVPNTTNPDGQTRLDRRIGQLHAMDDVNRIASPYGRAMEDMNNFYASARNMMYNNAVSAAFAFTAQERAPYGDTGFGDACLVAKKVLEANQGTRFIQITLGGWDQHNDIYGTQNPNNPTNLINLSRTFDVAFAQLLADLQANGKLNDTLVVVMGEFGRTVGALSGAAGRDHYLQQFVAFAGAGVRGGRAIGSTNATGSATDDPGWSRGRDIRPEDVEATIYSAMGINWTTIRYDDPLKRGFEYVPYADSDVYGPINELWA